MFLDVDCIPSPTLFARYETPPRRQPPALLSGPVAYLPPPPADGYGLDRWPNSAPAHPARPAPEPDGAAPLDHALFWSLSFAVTANTWTRIGGFCERYSGYGAEDTDFAQLARAAGHRASRIGGAWAYHQWHPSPEPPLHHLHDILRNAHVFRDRWGWWPMTGWLEAFRQLGLASYDPVTDAWTATPASHQPDDHCVRLDAGARHGDRVSQLPAGVEV